MRIALIGTGNVGGALAKAWARAGHDIVLGVRNTDQAEVKALAAETRAAVMVPTDAVQAAEVVVLAVPWNAAETVARTLGDLHDRIVIDCTNPLGPTESGFGLTVGHSQSGAELIAGWMTGGRLVKTLNQVGAEIMEAAARMSRHPVMFLAGDDDAAKTTVGTLLSDIGFDPLDAGDLAKARLLEPLAMVWINQAITRGKGRDWALSVTPAPVEAT